MGEDMADDLNDGELGDDGEWGDDEENDDAD